MTQIDSYLQQVADAKARDDVKAVNWLTACWMPYTLSVRQAARSGTAVRPVKAEAGPVQPMIPDGPIKNGKIVFHSSVRRAPLPVEDKVESDTDSE